MPSSDIIPGLAAISQAFGLTIQDPAAPNKIAEDTKGLKETDVTESYERYVNLTRYIA